MKTIIFHLNLIVCGLIFLPLTAEAYYHLSPYSYCSNNPVNCIDPKGEDIVVLNHTEGEHMAMLIQKEEGKWQYYSINGDNVYSSGEHSGGRTFNDVAVGSWDSPQEFLESPYNVRNDKSKENHDMNHFGYSEGYQISTTPQQDAIMRDGFAEIANTVYNLFDNNCATAVQKVMIDAGIPVSKPTFVPNMIPMSTPGGLVDVFNGYQMKCNIKVLPSSSFKSIMKWNPNGKYVHK